ncbi:MAG: hypothetical protein MJ110_02845 [Lachnospiraceae bacterium]|nr:hypothetical protein [Lachnospiraceae bacterium]
MRRSDDNVLFKKRRNAYAGMLVSIAVFAVVLGLFIFAVGKTANQSTEYELEVLNEAINDSLTSCYVTEGRYPDSFDYLKEKYGLTYDDSRFRVDYIVYGTNMRPQITIVTLGEENEQNNW